MLSEQPIVAFLPITNPHVAKDFYGGVLGLAIVEDTPFAVVMRTPHAELRLSVVEHVQPQPFTVLGWQVDALDATIDALTAKGVRLLRFEGMSQDDLGVWTSPSGARVAWFNDPDGNVLSLTALPSG